MVAQSSAPGFLGSLVQVQWGGLGLNFVCGAQFELIDACFLRFDVAFQQVEDFVGQQCQLLRDRLEFLAHRGARKPLDDASVEPMDLRPIGWPLP